MENSSKNRSQFKFIQNKNSYSSLISQKSNINLGKHILIPFFSSILGCTLVIGIYSSFYHNKSNLITTNSNENINQNLGYVTQTSLSNYSDTSIYAANTILPSIVGIEVEYNISSNLSQFNMLTPTSITTATGSGIIISDDGYILTNNHILSTNSSESYFEMSDATKIIVTLFNDDTKYEATIIGKDEITDLAIIKIEKTNLIKAEFADSDNIKVGEFAMAVGNPLGMQSSITCGVISGINRKMTDIDGKNFTLIQTDAAINSGNSGGALVNSHGKVIGINTLKLSGTGIEGLGFAIPINSTIDVTSQLIQFSKVKRPYLGISGMDISNQIALEYNMVVGVFVRFVEDSSSAQKAGLMPNDIIISIDEKAIKTMNELNEIKNSYQIGDEIKIKVIRDKQEKELTLILGEQP